MLVAGCRSIFALKAARRSHTPRTVSSFRATGRPGNQHFVVDQLSFGFATVLAIKPFDAARRINELLLAREERMAVGTNLKTYLGFSRASLPRLAARAMDRRIYILWMNIRLHCMLLSGIFLLP
jgi:hypothetical protein